VLPLDRLWREYWRVCKPNAAVVLTAQTPFDKALGASCLSRLKYEWIWVKPNGTGFLNAKKAPLKNHENVLVFYASPPTYNPQMRTGFKPYVAKQGRKSSNYGHVEPDHVTVSNGERFPVATLEFSAEKGVHPTQKPVALFEYLIRTYTNEGDLVLDNTAGSGTTAIAAENAGRRWICIERDDKYFAAATERVQKHVGGVDFVHQKTLEDMLS
jgi:site-specific DNA-methyltransferase (adenine-specific)